MPLIAVLVDPTLNDDPPNRLVGCVVTALGRVVVC